MGYSGILAVIWWVLKVLLMNDDSSFDATMGRDELTIAVGENAVRARAYTSCFCVLAITVAMQSMIWVSRRGMGSGWKNLQLSCSINSAQSLAV